MKISYAITVCDEEIELQNLVTFFTHERIFVELITGNAKYNDFEFKKEYFKAKEFYMKILSIKNLHKELYNQARSQLIFITND